jgi:Domain of unknown function (DUF4178)
MAGNTLSPEAATAQPTVKTFSCPTCAASVIVRAAGHSVTAVCSSCAQIIDVTNENYEVLGKARKELKRTKYIPLGRRGTLHGRQWEVIGYMERSDGSSYMWSEYLLFNPFQGFRWLTESDGHWNYVVMTKEQPDGDLYGREINFRKKPYRLFHSGKAKVSVVIGEFYWRVKQNEEVQVRDFIAPPESLSLEVNGTERIWSLGEYIEAEKVQKAFAISETLPMSATVAPTQPSAATSVFNGIKEYFGLFIAVLFILQMVYVFRAKEQEVHYSQYTYNFSDTEKTKVTPQFELKGGTSNVQVKLSAGVDNGWLEVQGDLVNDETGETYEFENGVEFYHGYDSDGAWSEGSGSNSVNLSAIPDGKYHLNLEPTVGQASPVTYNVTVYRDVATWSNFWWLLILLSVYPLFVWWRSRSFELDRWSQSDYSPFSVHQGDLE